jgi:hypothetical protein
MATAAAGATHGVYTLEMRAAFMADDGARSRGAAVECIMCAEAGAVVAVAGAVVVAAPAPG